MTDPVTTETDLAQAVGAAIAARDLSVSSKNDAVDAKNETEALVEIVRGIKDNISSDVVASLNLGGADGVAQLDGDGVVPLAQIPLSIRQKVSYKGSWNAATNTPSIPVASADNQGSYYVVSVAGTTTVDDLNEWKVGDWIISNGATWDRVEEPRVHTVAGRMGDVVLSSADLSDTGYANGVAQLNSGTRLVESQRPQSLEDMIAGKTSTKNFKLHCWLNGVDLTTVADAAATLKTFIIAGLNSGCRRFEFGDIVVPMQSTVKIRPGQDGLTSATNVWSIDGVTFVGGTFRWTAAAAPTAYMFDWGGDTSLFGTGAAWRQIRWQNVHFDGANAVNLWKLHSYYDFYFDQCEFRGPGNNVGIFSNGRDDAGNATNDHGLTAINCRWSCVPAATGYTGNPVLAYMGDIQIIGGYSEWLGAFDFHVGAVRIFNLHFSYGASGTTLNPALIFRDPRTIQVQGVEFDNGYVVLTDVGYNAPGTRVSASGWSDIHICDNKFLGMNLPPVGKGFINFEVSSANTTIEGVKLDSNHAPTFGFGDNAAETYKTTLIGSGSIVSMSGTTIHERPFGASVGESSGWGQTQVYPTVRGRVYIGAGTVAVWRPDSQTNPMFHVGNNSGNLFRVEYWGGLRLGAYLLPGRNRLRNPSFSVNQRQVSGTVTLAAGAYGHDGLRAGSGGATYTFALGANGLDTQITISAGTLIMPLAPEKIEGGDYVLQNAGTAQARVWQGTGYTGSGAYAAAPSTGLAAPALTAATQTNVEFSTGTILRPQFEYGAVATGFDRRPEVIDLIMCQRYFWRSGGTQAWQVHAMGGLLAANSKFLMNLPVPMRSTPSLTVNNVGSFRVFDTSNTNYTPSAITLNTPPSANNTGCEIYATISGGTAGRPCELMSNNSTTATLDFSAEL